MKHIIRDKSWVVACLMVLLSAGAQAVALQGERAFTAATRYNLLGQITGTIAPDPDGAGPLRFRATRNTYDARGLLVKSEAGELSAWFDESVQPKDWAAAAFSIHLTAEFGYDDFGRKLLERVRGANGAAEALIQYSYTDNSLVRCKAVRMNPVVFLAPPPDPCAPGAEGAFGPDRVTRYGYDALDQVVTEERAVGVPGLQQVYVRNTYQHRLLTAQVDANLNRTELRYDSYGRLKRKVFPSAELRGLLNEADYNEFTYDRAGNPLVERKRDGRTITTDYDANHRPIRKDLSDNTWSSDVYYNYDLRGLELYSRFGSDSGPGEVLTYDGFGNLRVRSSTLLGFGRPIYYSYDADGNRTRVGHPDGYFFAYTFDGLDRVIGLSSSDAPGDAASTTPVLSVGYAREGKRSTLTRSGGTVTTYVRDNAQRFGRFAQTFASAADSFENSFSYNPASQIVRFAQSNDQYNFREVANRTGVYLSNGLNQYTAIGGQPIAYDANGNLREDGAVRYTYDMENRLVAASGKVEGADVNASLKWDTNGRLHELVVNGVATQFLYDGNALIAEYSGGAMTRRYVHGDQVDEPWVQYNGASTAAAERRFLLADHLGSIVAHADYSGRPVNKLAYDSYGIPAAANVDRFGFTGQAWIKQLGLYHYKARMYHPKLGRFLQTDPIGYRDDFNLYAYVQSDPVNGSDPSGMCMDNCHVLEQALVDVTSGKMSQEDFDTTLKAHAIVGGAATALGLGSFFLLANAPSAAAITTAGTGESAALTGTSSSGVAVSSGAAAIQGARAQVQASGAMTRYSRADYAVSSRSAAAQQARTSGAGQPCPNCTAPMRPGTANAPWAQHRPPLSQFHYEGGGAQMSAAEKAAYANSPQAYSGAMCAACQRSEGGFMRGWVDNLNMLLGL